MSKALEDVVVLELTTEFWSAVGAAMLADFGARVIRVEPLPEAREARTARPEQEPAAGWDHDKLGLDKEETSCYNVQRVSC